MNFHIISIFPDSIREYLNISILGRARKNGYMSVKFYNPRKFTKDRHKRVDDKAYGGGPGMVMQAEPLIKAAHKARGRKKKVKTIILSPSGETFTNSYAENLIKNYKHVILIAGRYEGIDARVKKILKAEEVSIGPYTLTGGELPAAVIVDAVTRRLPGVLGTADSIEEKRNAGKDVYTRPEVIEHTPLGRGKKSKKYRVPKVLLSGHHKDIEKWRKESKK